MDDTAGEYRRFESDVSGYTQTTEGAAELLNIAWQKLRTGNTSESADNRSQFTRDNEADRYGQSDGRSIQADKYGI